MKPQSTAEHSQRKALSALFHIHELSDTRSASVAVIDKGESNAIPPTQKAGGNLLSR